MKQNKNNNSPMTHLLAVLAAALIIVFVIVLVRYYRGGDESEQTSGAPAAEELQTETWKPEEQQTQEEELPQPKTDQTDTEAQPWTESVTESEPEGPVLTIAIDPGHQGSWVDMSDPEPIGPGASETKSKSSTGTEGPYSGLAEYELNLQISLKLQTELNERGYDVVLTREDNDTAISNSERAVKAYEEGGDIYVRIHANGSDDPAANGALALVPSKDNPYVAYLADDSYLLADCILNAYCEEAGFASLGIQYDDSMSGINWSQIPVMILEMGYMTNEFDDLKMADEETQSRMVSGIADGIDAYFAGKGLRDLPEEETGKSELLSEKMNTLLEILGEVYVYPATDQGEKWALSIADLTSGEEMDLNGGERMKAASVAKVFLMAAVYDRILDPPDEEKRISADLSEDELRSLLSDMITVSDNEAANALLGCLGEGDAAAGLAEVNQYLDENGYADTHMGRLFLEEDPSDDNYTSANDCRAILESIRDGSCVSAAASEEMLSYLRQQTRTGKIPAGAGSSVTANKTGELAGEYGDYVENDIAIIEDGDEAAVLCVLSQDLNDNGEAQEKIKEITETLCQTLWED